MNGVGVPEDRQRAGALLYKGAFCHAFPPLFLTFWLFHHPFARWAGGVLSGCELQHGYSCKVLGDFFTTGALSHPVHAVNFD